MEWIGQRKGSRSHKRWIRKYQRGRLIYNDNIDMSRKKKEERGTTVFRRPSASHTVQSLKYRVARLERGQSGREFKYHDFDVSETSTTTAKIHCLNLIAQGNTSITREGLLAALQSIYVKFQVIHNANDLQGEITRVMLVLDRECDGANVTVDEVLEATDVLAFREKHETRSRFKVLFDKNITTQPLAGTAGQAVRKYREYYKKLKKPIQMNYTDSTAAIGSNGKNALFLLHFSTEVTNPPTVDFNCRLRYTD